MVQIIEEKPSFWSAVGGGAKRGINKAFEQYAQMAQEKKAQERQNRLLDEENKQILKLTGKDFSGIRDPKVRAQAFSQLIKAKSKKEFYDNLFGEESFDDAQGNDQASDVYNFNEDPIENEGPTNQEQPTIRGPKTRFSDKQILGAAIEDPALAREMRAAKDADLKQSQFDRKEAIAFHKDSEDYDKDILAKYKTALSQINAIKDIQKSVKSGNVKPTSIANVLKHVPKIGKALSDAVQNKDEATIRANLPYLIEGWKDIFGVRLSDADLKVIQDKLPDIGKSQEANEAILQVMEKYGNLAKLKYDISKKVKNENHKLRKLGYEDEVEERFEKATAPISVISPKTGKSIEIPRYKLESAIIKGYKLADE